MEISAALHNYSGGGTVDEFKLPHPDQVVHLQGEFPPPFKPDRIRCKIASALRFLVALPVVVQGGFSVIVLAWESQIALHRAESGSGRRAGWGGCQAAVPRAFANCCGSG